jgi:putative lipoprotein
LRSDTVHPVLTHGAGASVEISMVRTTAEISAPPEPSGEVGIVGVSGEEAELVGPTWVAEDIGGKGVIDNLQSHITFMAEGRAQGSGGCNGFRGGYTLEGQMLNIGQLASLKMACSEAIMAQETRFHEALAQTRGYRIEMGLLYLVDAQGETLMRLWQRD